MDVLTDPLYGMLGAVAVLGVGLYMGFAAGSKLGWVIFLVGAYWGWAVLGQQEWGIPPPPFP